VADMRGRMFLNLERGRTWQMQVVGEGHTRASLHGYALFDHPRGRSKNIQPCVDHHPRTALGSDILITTLTLRMLHRNWQRIHHDDARTWLLYVLPEASNLEKLMSTFTPPAYTYKDSGIGSPSSPCYNVVSCRTSASPNKSTTR